MVLEDLREVGLGVTNVTRVPPPILKTPLQYKNSQAHETLTRRIDNIIFYIFVLCTKIIGCCMSLEITNPQFSESLSLIYCMF